MQFLLKVLLSALVIAASSELAKRSAVYGGVVASLPLTSILALVWLYADTRDAAAAASFSSSIFWAVLVSLPMFLALSWLLRRGAGFFPSLGAACVVAGIGYAAYLASLGRR
jgi:hypothetical protein